MTDETSRLADLEADNARLRGLLDKRDAPAELRHRLRSTLALLRMIIRQSAETYRDIEIYVGHVEDRLDALARVQAQADEKGVVFLDTLITEELFFYKVSEGERATISGPNIALQPRAGQVFALAIHELAVNAVEHGAIGANGGQIDVGWGVSDNESGGTLVLTWEEREGETVAQPSYRGFGTEVLTRMLPYELNAETHLEFQPEGLRCTIMIPLREKTGAVIA